MDTNHAPGRPRSQDVDEAILRAATELLASKGPEGLTINSVARRSRVARASIYLRYPGRDSLLAATLRAAIGREPYPLSGDLQTDLRGAAVQTQAILATASFRAVLPEIVRGLLRAPGGDAPITFDLVAPNLRPLAEAYRRGAEAAGLRTDLDPNLPARAIVGALLLVLLADGTPPTPDIASQTAALILAGLKAGAVDPPA